MNIIEKVFPLTTNVTSQGKLQIGGCDIETLATKYETPFYVFDTAHIENICDEYTNEFNNLYEYNLLVKNNKLSYNDILSSFNFKCDSSIKYQIRSKKIIHN